MKTKDILKEYFLITVSSVLIIGGVYFFKFPNNFSFGGITGLAIILGKVTPFSPGTVNLFLNFLLLIVGFLVLGRSFAIKTVYASVLLSVGLSGMEYLFPMQKPLTDQPLLELIFAVALPAFGSAVLFNIGASSGGTDIIALILKKYTSFDIGRAVLISDLLITLRPALCLILKLFYFHSLVFWQSH